ncbi:MAG: hypothetical protein JSS09_00930 [Verrucomicrobia bacterium]|nr:hypothetical protein [Verrucomicrobiota bacterium]
MGCKTHFLAQQIDLAKRFSPTLSRILTIFGEDIRSPLPENRFNSNLSQELIEELKILLKDPTLGDKTLEFCEHITSNYSFNEVLEGALKRTAWHHVIPELGEIEANALSDFYREFGCFLQNPEEEKVINVTTIPEMKIKIYEAVRQHLEKK